MEGQDKIDIVTKFLLEDRDLLGNSLGIESEILNSEKLPHGMSV